MATETVPAARDDAALVPVPRMSAETKEEIDALANSANAQVSDLAEGARLLLDSHQEGSEVSVAVLLGRIEELANAMCELVLYGTVEHRRSVIKGQRPG